MTSPDHDYLPPVDQLLTLGEPPFDPESMDPAELGIGPEHVPELVRMATGEALYASEQEPELWAPIHAWRALARLRAAEAVEPLLALVGRHEDNDWIREEIPMVLGMMGPVALPALERHLAPGSPGETASRTAAAIAVGEVAEFHPGARAEAVAVLSRALERHAENDPATNGFLIAELLDLEAAEAAPAIERAFAAGTVDLSIAGDWEEAQVELGLKEERETPPRRIIYLLDADGAPEPGPARRPPSRATARTKARKKLEKESRKKNRRRR